MDMDQTPNKDRLETFKEIAQIFSLVALPVVLAVGGWLIQNRIATESTRSQYVEIAVGILREPPKKGETDDQSLRKWAVSIVDMYAPVRLTPETKEALLSEQLLFNWKDLPRPDFSKNLLPFELGDGCQEYLILTEDNEGFEKCARASLQRIRTTGKSSADVTRKSSAASQE
jgi:hypothetical protein